MIYIETTMGCLLPAEPGVPPIPSETSRATLGRAGCAQTHETNEKGSRELQSRGFAPQKSGTPRVLSGWAQHSTQFHSRGSSPKVPKAGRCCICLAQRATQVLPNRVWPSICHSHGERQRSKLLGLPFLLRVNASGSAGPAAAPSPVAPHSLHNPGWMP